MTVGLACLLGFAAWTPLLLILGIGRVRIGKVLTGEAKPNAFPADVPHGSDRYAVRCAHTQIVWKIFPSSALLSSPPPSSARS